MKQCPRCKLAFKDAFSDDTPLPDDQIMLEVYLRQRTSMLCADCILEELIMELGQDELRKTA